MPALAPKLRGYHVMYLCAFIRHLAQISLFGPSFFLLLPAFVAQIMAWSGAWWSSSSSSNWWQGQGDAWGHQSWQEGWHSPSWRAGRQHQGSKKGGKGKKPAHGEPAHGESTERADDQPAIGEPAHGESAQGKGQGPPFNCWAWRTDAFRSCSFAQGEKRLALPCQVSVQDWHQL